MKIGLLLGLVLSFLPITEIRGGLPVIIYYTYKNSLPLLPFFLLSLTFNILSIFFVYFFLDFFNEKLLKMESYKKFFNKIIEKRIRKKREKLEKEFNQIGYLALFVFVAIPLPGTGAWTGTLIAWLLGLNRKKSFFAIACGVLFAGLFILFSYYGFHFLLKLF
ncbi:MAG: small multi-drug export protein [Candidatus Pacearchaeota archaeon]